MALRNKNRNEKMLSNPGSRAVTQDESNQQEDIKPTGVASGLSKSISAKVISDKRPASNLPRQDRSNSRTISSKSKPATKPACPNVPALDLKQLNPSSRTNEVLKHKPGIASTLFHPSKINMSSTPIKTNTKKRVVIPTEDMSSTPIKHTSQTHLNLNTNKQVADELLFEHDTPIKGHKIKQMNEVVNAQCGVPNRYVARVNVPDYSNETCLNNKIYTPSSPVEGHNKNHLLINIDKNQADLDGNKNKNEDDESGVETDELNKSNELKQQQAEQLEYAAMKSVQRDMLFGKDSSAINRDYQFENNFQKSTVSSRTKLINEANRSRLERSLSSSVVVTKAAAVCKSKPSSARVAENSSSGGQADDSLAKLRRKQKQMLESKKFLHNDSVSDQDATLKLNEAKYVEDSTGNSSSKKQLRNYVQNLELKLKHLRSEMNDNSLLSFDADKASKLNSKRSNKLKQAFINAADSNSSLSDSSDSLKEISISQKSNSNKFYNNVSVQHISSQHTNLKEL